MDTNPTFLDSIRQFVVKQLAKALQSASYKTFYHTKAHSIVCMAKILAQEKQYIRIWCE